MKKHSKLTVGLAVALCIMICICAATAITLAKYISSVTATDSAPVAKWELQVNDISIKSPGEQVLEIDLFDTIYDEDTESEEEHVVDGLLAPGTGGVFEITIKNLSQVDALLTMKVEEQNEAGIPIQYSLDKETWFDSISRCKLNLNKSFLEMLTGSVSRTVYWRWCFEGGEGAHKGQSDDTDNALLADPDNLPVLQINVSILAEQYYELPVLAANETWYTGRTNIARSSIKEITIVDSIEDYDMAGKTIVDQWDASTAYDEDDDKENGPVTAYVLSDSTLIIAGNGTGKVYANKDSSKAFYGPSKTNAFVNASAINGLSTLDTSMVTTMNSMFRYLSNVSTLDVGNWDVSNVTSMYGMFAGNESIPSGLITLDVSKWDVSNVTDFTATFQDCPSLTTLDVSNWDTGSATTMQYMFTRCRSLKSLDVSKWDTGNCKNMYYLFTSCNSLGALDVSNWDTGYCENMAYMFYGCRELTSLDLRNWDVSNVTTFQYMLGDKAGTYAMKLEDLNMSGWDTSSAENFNHMFTGCAQLTSLDLCGWDVRNVVNMCSMFADCLKLETIDFTGWNTENLLYFNSLFNDCESLKRLDVSGFDVSNVEVFAQVFEQCRSLTEIKGLETWDTSKGVGFAAMFENCNSLTYLDLSNFDTRNAKDGIYVSDNDGCNAATENMFYNMYKLESITLGKDFDFDGDGTTTRGIGYLPVPDGAQITGADGKWYDSETGTGYSPEGLLDVTRDHAVTYVVVNPAA